MSGYDAHEWVDFGVGVVGAAAALSGLLFVAVSINIERILSYPTLPTRALQTLLMLILPLAVGILVLVPGQPALALGVELVVTGVVFGATLLRMSRPSSRSDKEPWTGWLIGRFGPSVAVPALAVVAGVSLAAGTGGGLYWIAPAVLLAFLAGLANAWVLLVEILR